MTRLFALEDTVTTDDWYTPPWIFDGLGLTFDIDVAAPIGGIPWIPAHRSYSESDDGLTQPWEGLVWCNPPYGSPAAWCRRWAQHPTGCILIPADLSTGGPHTAFTAAHCIYVADRRLQFIRLDSHTNVSRSAFSTVLLGRGPDVVPAFHRLAARCGGTARTMNSYPSVTDES